MEHFRISIVMRLAQSVRMKNVKDRCGFSLQLEEDSDYDKLSDMVKYLDLELHFGTQKSPGE